MDDLQESQNRLEAIIVTLISQQKELQIDIKESLADMRSSYESLVEIVRALSGNGLKKKDKND
jgi:biopolymer transport protein ExbD